MPSGQFSENMNGQDSGNMDGEHPEDTFDLLRSDPER